MSDQIGAAMILAGSPLVDLLLLVLLILAVVWFIRHL